MNTVTEFAEKDFTNKVWPTSAHEEWRRSDPNAIPFSKLESGIYESECEIYAAVHTEVYNVASSQKEVHYERFSPQALSQNSSHPVVSQLLSRSISTDTDKVDLWRVSRLSAETAGIIVVADDAQIENPIRIIIRGSDPEAVYAPQLFVIVGKRARYNISISLEGEGFFLPAVYCHVCDEAEVHYSLFQNVGLDSIVISNVFLECANLSRVTATSTQFGAMIGVDRIHGRVIGERATVMLNGCYYGCEDQLLDIRAYQHHQSPNSESRAVYHGVARDEAHTVFRGLIGVGDDAINTDAYLTNKNLLLSEDARMDSIPCLNINTNEVRCSHGSTTGNLNPEHVFYLMSRGLSETQAKHLLIEGFFEAVFDDVFDGENEKALEIIRSRMVDA